MHSVSLENLLYWAVNMKECVKNGWISKDWQECNTCIGCVETAKRLTNGISKKV